MTTQACRYLVLAFLLIELTIWSNNAHALPACPGQSFYLKSGEALDIQFNRKPGCDVRFMTVERGAIERRLIYPSGKLDNRTVTKGQPDISEAWSELPQKAYLRASIESVVRFVAERPPAGAQEINPQEVCPGQTIQLQPGQEVVFRLGKRPGCTVAWSNYEGTIEEFATYPSSQPTQRTVSPTSGEFRYPESPLIIRVKAVTPAALKFLAQKPAAAQQQPPKPLPQIPQSQQPALQKPKPEIDPAIKALKFEQFVDNVVKPFFLLAVTGIAIYLVIYLASRSTTIVLAHWYTLIDNLQASSMEFYESVEDSIKKRQVPSLEQSRVDWKEGGLFTALREYLRISRERHVLDICGAPYGTGFFVSLWLGELRPSAVWPTIALLGLSGISYWILNTLLGGFLGMIATVVAFILVFLLLGVLINQSGGADWVRYILVIPILGWLLEHFFLPTTYYRIDTALMFEQSIRKAVLEVIDGMTEAKGLRTLSESERKPVLRDFFKR